MLSEIAAAGDTQPLTDHIRAFTHSMHAMDILLRDLGLAFTCEDSLWPRRGTRPPDRAAWDGRSLKGVGGPSGVAQ